MKNYLVILLVALLFSCAQKYYPAKTEYCGGKEFVLSDTTVTIDGVSFEVQSVAHGHYRSYYKLRNAEVEYRPPYGDRTYGHLKYFASVNGQRGHLIYGCEL